MAAGTKNHPCLPPHDLEHPGFVMHLPLVGPPMGVDSLDQLVHCDQIVVTGGGAGSVIPLVSPARDFLLRKSDALRTVVVRGVTTPRDIDTLSAIMSHLNMNSSVATMDISRCSLECIDSLMQGGLPLSLKCLMITSSAGAPPDSAQLSPLPRLQPRLQHLFCNSGLDSYMAPLRKAHPYLTGLGWCHNKGDPITPCLFDPTAFA
jgi:hypothetical protein